MDTYVIIRRNGWITLQATLLGPRGRLGRLVDGPPGRALELHKGDGRAVESARVGARGVCHERDDEPDRIVGALVPRRAPGGPDAGAIGSQRQPRRSDRERRQCHEDGKADASAASRLHGGVTSGRSRTGRLYPRILRVNCLTP